jgi:hypothetical protein
MAESLSVEYCDFRARCWVCGTTKDRDGKITFRSATWHERHHHHPWVRESEIEGWGRELRSVVIPNLTRTFPDLESLMPDGEWVKHTKLAAARSNEAGEWLRANPQKKDVFNQKLIADVSRDAFRAMQRRSRNTHLHIDHAAIARRVIGDRSE